jgi:hypothetical protein
MHVPLIDPAILGSSVKELLLSRSGKVAELARWIRNFLDGNSECLTFRNNMTVTLLVQLQDIDKIRQGVVLAYKFTRLRYTPEI